MADLGFTQAALAREAGVSQQTVGRLVTGGASGSRYIHRIARALKTTPAHLSGETDDPNAELPDEPQLTADERQFVEKLRALTRSDRKAISTLVHSLATSAGGATLHDRQHTFRGE